MTKAVIFDLDGTLLDTLDDLADSMNAVLGRLGFPAHEADAYKYFIGDGMVNLARRALPPDRRDEELVQSVVLSMEEEYALSWDAKTGPYPGVPELLEALEVRGKGMSVLSNKPDGFTRTMVAHFFPGRTFAFVHGARDGVPRKPDPQAALEIAVGMDVPPRDICYLGDTATDMKTARAAGMLAVGALWGFRDEEELRDSGAAFVISRPSELLACV